MILQQITDYLEEIAPLRFQESYDNSGLIVGDKSTEITGAIISLDCTPSVIMEAKEAGCNLIISHHPIVFSGIKKFNANYYVHKAVILAIKHDIAIYAIHTNLDNVLRSGVNQKIAQRLGLDRLSTLKSHLLNPMETAYEVGAGIIGHLPNPLSESDFLLKLKSDMNASVIRHTSLLDKDIQSVAICGGAGSFLLPQAIAAGADIYVTADYKYHEFFDANGQIIIADIGHYESEYYTIELLLGLLTKKFPNFAARSTTVVTNPVNYI